MSDVPEEISVEDFLKLSEEVPERGKIREADLLAFISNKAKPTNAIAEHFNVTYSAMYSRLKRLLEDGKVERRFDPNSGKSYWLAK